MRFPERRVNSGRLGCDRTIQPDRSLSLVREIALLAQYPALPLWTDAYLGDTTHLTTLEHGAYFLLLLAMWRNKGTLPNDDSELARYARLLPGQWRAIAQRIRRFFKDLGDGTITQPRLADEYARVEKICARRSAAGKAGRLKQLKNMRQRWANAWQTPGKAQAPTPTPTPTEKIIDKPVELEREEVSQSAKPLTKGTRWQATDLVSQEWLAKAEAVRERHGLLKIELALEAEKFGNYWSACSGPNGIKRDWCKTWLNWALRAEAGRRLNGAGTRKRTAHENFALGAALAVGAIDDAPDE